MNLKSPIKWSGGKGDEINQFSEFVPKSYDTYIEPFVGGGSVFFSLKPQKAVIADIHPDLIDFYNVLKKGGGDRIWEWMKRTPNDSENYYSIRDKFIADTEYKRACRFYYQRKTCYRGMMRYNKKGGFNIPFGRYPKINFDDIKNPGYGEILKNTSVICSDYKSIFKKYGDNPDNFCFLDPPYDSVFTDYGYCKFGKEHHQELSQLFKETKMKCLMIIGKTDFIEELYSGYIAKSYPKKYKFRLHSKRVGDEINAEHLVVKNYLI